MYEIGLKLKSVIRRNADVIEAVARYNYPDNLKVVKCTSNDPQLPLWLGTFVHSIISQRSWPWCIPCWKKKTYLSLDVLRPFGSRFLFWQRCIFLTNHEWTGKAVPKAKNSPIMHWVSLFQRLSSKKDMVSSFVCWEWCDDQLTSHGVQVAKRVIR